MSGASYDGISLPFDSRAESAVLNFALTYPSQTLELGLVPDDFYDRNRRRIWQVMVSGRLENPDVLDPASFYLSVFDRLAADTKREPRSILRSIDLSADWRAFAPGSRPADIDHFVSEVQRCVQARRIIEAAQEIADRAYQVPHQCFDVTDASVVLSRVAGAVTNQRLGIELPI